MSLSLMKAGEEGYIKKITGKDEVKKHLASLGFLEGEKVRVISKIGGDMILNVKNTRVALSKNMIHRIIV